MDKWIHNTSGATKIYMGTEVANGSYHLFPILQHDRLKESDEIISEINADDARMSIDGVADLSIADSLIFLAYDNEGLDQRFRGDSERSNGFSEKLNVQTAIEQARDSARGTLLPYSFIGNGNTQNKWLSFSSGGFSPSNQVPMVVPEDSIIKGITYVNSLDDTDLDIEVYVNAVLQHTESIRNKRVAWVVGSLSITMNQGDRISVFVKKITTGTGASNPQNVLVTLLGKFINEAGANSGIQNGL